MKKEEIYVVIDSKEKRLRAIQILTDAGEDIYEDSKLFSELFCGTISLESTWGYYGVIDKTEITLDQLEEVLNPKQEEPIKLDALKLIAESYGFELVEKKREPKVGDFGKFYTDDKNRYTYGFITSIANKKFQKDISIDWYRNFANLTDEEKQQIQENW